MKRALITGIGGQDGFFLSKLLLQKGYKVYGVSDVKLPILFETDNEVWNNIENIHCNILDREVLQRAIKRIAPDEMYHFAAQSNVGLSYKIPEETENINVNGTKNILDGLIALPNRSKLYFAGSSEMFGNALYSPQDENTPFNPISPYGKSKVKAYLLCQEYARKYNIFIATGISYNHESVRRTADFVTMKICKGLLAYKSSEDKTPLQLGNLSSVRDWGLATEYVEAMWKIMQLPQGDRYVIATGKAHSIEEFCNLTAEKLGIRLKWIGEGLNRSAINLQDSKPVIVINSQYYFPAEQVPLVGNASKIFKDCGWKADSQLDSIIENLLNN